MSSSSSSSVSVEMSERLEGIDLITALRTQLEFYFSKQNLLSDSYLTSQMDTNKYVPISVIASFRKIQSLTNEEDKVVEAMKQCKNLELDLANRKVRPVQKVERNTLILRDIPSSTPVEEVKEIFQHKQCGQVIQLRPDINDTWFVVFENEEKCMDTALFLQSGAVTFKGKPVSCRVKSENLMRGFYIANDKTNNNTELNLPSAANNTSSSSGSHPYRHVATASGVTHPSTVAPFNPYGQYPAAYWNVPYGQTYPYDEQHNTQRRKNHQQHNNAHNNNNNNNNNTGNNVQGKKKRQDGSSFSHDGNNAHHGGPVDGKKKSLNNGKNGKKGPLSAPVYPIVNLPAVAASGVPLVAPASLAPPVNAPLPPSTSTQRAPATTYTREEMASVVQELIKKSFTKPESFDKLQDPEKAVLKETPSSSICLLHPFPVIYPASPSPLLAAQPIHSSQLPFLDLNSSSFFLPEAAAAAPAPFDVNARAPGHANNNNNNHNNNSSNNNNNNNNNNRRNKQPTSQGPPNQAQNSSRKPAPSTSSTTNSAPTHRSKPAQPNQPRPSTAHPKSTDASASSNNPTPSATQTQSARPLSAAAIVAAAGNAPVQTKKAPAPVAANTAATSSSSSSTQPSSEKKSEGKEKDSNKKQPNNGQKPAAKGKKQTGAGSSTTASTPAATPVSTEPPKPTFASRVGSLPPEELEKLKKAREEKLKAEQEKLRKEKEQKDKEQNKDKEQKDQKEGGKKDKKPRKEKDGQERKERKEKESKPKDDASSSSSSSSSSTDSSAAKSSTPSYAEMIRRANAAKA